MRDKLKRQEDLLGPSGASPNAKRADMLDESELQAANPDKRYRWGSLRNEQKMQRRLNEGYERVPVTEGGRQVGNLVLLAVPREVHDRKVAADKALREARLHAHKGEVEKMAEAVAKELRDKHGFKINSKEFLISD
jgi:hypothetical protein